MIKNILTGILVGCANIIPGLSGGTIMVLLGMFDKITTSISNVFSFKNGIFKGKKEDILFLLQVTFGIIVGIIGFAKIIEFLFMYMPIQTMYFFVGLILFSLPSLIKSEIPNTKINKSFLIIGLLIIGIISFLAPNTTETVITNFPTLTLPFSLYMILLGIIAGATTIFPGISGSMILLIIGEYYLYKSYAANVLTFDINIIIPLGFIAVGILIGIIACSKLTKWLLNKYKLKTISLIIGLIIASSIFLIPFKAEYNTLIIISSFGSLLFGGTLSYLLDKN